MLKRTKHIQILSKYRAILWIAVFGILLFFGCRQRPILHEYASLENSIWTKTDNCIFNLEIEELDTLYDIVCYLRHTTNYPYSNLWLFVDRVSPEGKITSDTLACEVADYAGRWKAKGVGSILTLPIIYKEKYSFKQQGNYRYSIRHGMRTDSLQGVQAIGFKLDYHGKK